MGVGSEYQKDESIGLSVRSLNVALPFDKDGFIRKTSVYTTNTKKEAAVTALKAPPKPEIDVGEAESVVTSSLSVIASLMACRGLVR
jgi:hypothetical protein